MALPDSTQTNIPSSSDAGNRNAILVAFSRAQAMSAGPPTSVTPSFSLPTENLPITTVFTPPASCFKPSQWLLSPNSWASGTVAFGINVADYPECYPLGLPTYGATNNVWFSPGVCPQSWNYLATVTRVTGDSTVTSAYCCQPGILSGALSQASDTTDYNCWHNFDNGYTRFFGKPMSVAWEESDLDSFSPASAPLIRLEQQGVSATTATSRQSSTSKQSPTGRQSPTRISNPGISTGAAAGIAVGATIGCLAVLGLLLWFLRKHLKLYVLRREPPQHTQAEIRSSDGQAQYPTLLNDFSVCDMSIIAKNIMLQGKFMYTREDVTQFIKMLEAGLLPSGKDLVETKVFKLDEWRESFDVAAEWTGIGKCVTIEP